MYTDVLIIALFAFFGGVFYISSSIVIWLENTKDIEKSFRKVALIVMLKAALGLLLTIWWNLSHNNPLNL